MANTYSAGIVTAYGAAKKAGYTGTYEEFCAEQASFARNAQQVRQDKESIEQTVETFSETTVPAAVQSVTDEGNTQRGRVEAAGDRVVEAVGNAGTSTVRSVNEAGTTQVENVQNEGSTQVQVVADKGAEVIGSIPPDYSDLAAEVDDLNRQLSDEVSNTNDSLLNLNSIPVNIEYLDISASMITQAATVGLEITVTGINKFTINGTATKNFVLWLDFEQTEIGGANTLYYLVNRSDGINRYNGMWVQLSWFLADGTPYQPADNISVFNEVVPYTYPATAVKTRNYLRIPSGASFNNTEFEIIIMRKAPLDANIITKVNEILLADTYNTVPLTWESATGYWATNKTFATYSNIYTATIDVTAGDKYLLDARSYYGMCIGVYYSGDTISASSIIDIIHISNDDVQYNKIEIQVPKDAEHLLLQQYYTNRAIIREIDENAVVKSTLSGKTIAYDGDSIAESRMTGAAENGGGYPYFIAAYTGGFYINQAVSGAVLASAVPDGAMPHSVVNNLPSMPNDADLYCFEGGLNDFYRNVPLGDYSATDYRGTVDTTTICGALEHILRAATYNWVGKPICFVFVHKAVGTIDANSAGYTFEQMREKMMGICRKYAIPFYDAYTESGLNGYNDIQNQNFLTGGQSKPYDGIHPNAEGYKRYYVPQLIKLFEAIMPR